MAEKAIAMEEGWRKQDTKHWSLIQKKSNSDLDFIIEVSYFKCHAFLSLEIKR